MIEILVITTLSVLCNLAVFAMLRDAVLPTQRPIPVPTIVAYAPDITFDHRGLV